MRQFVFLFILTSVLNALAIQMPSNNEAVAPVLMNSDNSDETHIGVITADATPQRPDALTILRQELQRQAAAEHAQAQKDGVFWSTTKRFTPESITFFIAIGLVTYNSMWIHSHGDPLAMERHILSLKDPIAHLSFYAFMQANGFYMDWRTKKLGVNAMDPLTRRQMMTRLSYQGMAIGSLAASIVADLGQSIKMCTDQWIKGKTDERSLESCNQAWVRWTARDKFTQYFPQIIALWASQALTSVIEKGVLKTFDTATSTSLVKKFLNKEYLVKTAYKITGADVTLTFVGGGWAMKSIKLAGKVTKFTLFVGVDHFLSSYIYRPLNNLVRPLFFDQDVIEINKLWLAADKGNWDASKIGNTAPIEKFEKEMENYGSQMQQWREHLNSDAEGDLAGWMEMTKELLNQMDYAYKYYRGFATSLFETLNTDYLIKNKQLAPSALSVISRYPLRTLPFYGVSTGPYKAIGGQIEDYYLLSPNEIEMRQKEHVINTAKKYSSAAQNLRKYEQAQFNRIIEKLLSGDNNKMSSGINDLNKVNASEQIYVAATGTWEDNSGYSLQFQDLVLKLKREIGNPQPVVYPLAGYSQAFAANSINQVVAEAADYSKWSLYNKYQFNKEADLMMYKLICGKPQGNLYRVKLGIDWLSPQFDPPSLLKPNAATREFCDKSKSTRTLYSTKIGNQDLKDYVIANFNYSSIGDYKNKMNADIFDKWWIKNAKEPLNKDFKNFDTEFQKLFKLSYSNFFEIRTFDFSTTSAAFKTYYDMFKTAVDKLNISWYLPSSINASLKAETRVYLQMLSRILMKDAGLPQHETLLFNQLEHSKTITFINYLEFATRTSEQLNYIPLYKSLPKELERLDLLLAAYPTYMMQQNVSFDRYIAHSKKIDTAINDILVLLGLKRLVANSSNDIEDLSAPEAPSASGNENTDKVYEDIPVQNPTYKQRMAIAAIRGLRQVESEIRRFIRMRVMLSQSLELDTQEFMKDWNNANPTQLDSSKAKKISPISN